MSHGGTAPNWLGAAQLKVRDGPWRPFSWAYNRYLRIFCAVSAPSGDAGVPSLLELHSLGMIFGGRAVVQAASPPSPRSLANPRERRVSMLLGTKGVAGVAGVALCCQTAYGTPTPDFLSGFTPIAFPKSGYTTRQWW